MLYNIYILKRQGAFFTLHLTQNAFGYAKMSSAVQVYIYIQYIYIICYVTIITIIIHYTVTIPHHSIHSHCIITSPQRRGALPGPRGPRGRRPGVSTCPNSELAPRGGAAEHGSSNGWGWRFFTAMVSDV